MSAERQEQSRGTWSRFLRWSGIALGILVLLIVGSAVILPLVFPSDQVKSVVVPRVESALGRDVEVGTARVRVIPWPSLRLDEFQVANAEGFGPEPAIEGDALDLNLQLFPLFRGEIEIDNIELNEPLIRYEVNEQGVSNFADFGGAEDGGEGAPLAVAVSNFSVYDGSLSYVNRQSNQETSLTLDFQADAVPDSEAGTVASQGTVTIHALKSGEIDFPEEPLTLENLQLEYDITANVQDEQISVDRLAVVSGSFLLEMSGVVENLSTEPTVDLQIQNEGTNLSGLAALTGAESTDDMALEGQASFDLEITGPVGTPSEISVYGPVQLSNFAYGFETFNEPLRIPEAELSFGGQQVSLEETILYLGENGLELDLEVNDLLAAFGEEGTTPALPTAQFQLTSDRLDFTGLYAETETDEPGYFDLVQARLAGAEIDGRDAGTIAEEFYGEMSLPPVELTGAVEIGTLVNPPYRVDDLSLEVTVGSQEIAVRSISGEMYDGTVAGEIAVDLSAEGAPYPADYRFSLQDAGAGLFMEDWTSLGAAVTGNLDYSVDGSTAFDAALLPVVQSTNADGEATVTDGGFRNLTLVEAIIDRLGINAEALTSFERLGGPYQIQEGQFLVDNWEVETNVLDGELDGSFGFGGSIDLQLALGMPVTVVQDSRLVEMIGGNIGSFLGRIAGEDETVTVVLNIGGTMSNPGIQIDTDALENRLRRLIRGAGERIPDFLRLR